jgi:ADP-ribosylglycohydrolase
MLMLNCENNSGKEIGVSLNRDEGVRAATGFTRAQRMLAGIAVGDAFGRYYENKSRSEIIEIARFDRYLQEEVRYSDDTQMSLAVAELMISPLPFTAETLASNFIHAWKRDRRRGYSTRTQKVLEESRTGAEFLELFRAENPAQIKSNGSAMRALPLGLYRDGEEVVAKSVLNSEITHAHPEAVKASVCVSLLAHYFYYRLGDPGEVISFVREKSAGICPAADEYLGKVESLTATDYTVLLGDHADRGLPCDALLTLGVVLHVARTWFDDPREALRQSILVGGDVDSVASLVLGGVMMLHPFDALPPFLLDDLENLRYGRDYTLDLGSELSKKYTTGEE